MRAAAAAPSVARCASAARMFDEDTSMPVSVAPGRASTSRNTSEPVPHPRSSTSIARSFGTCRTTSSHMRADRSAGAEHVLSANSSVRTFIHDVARSLKDKSLRTIAHILEKAPVRVQHPLVSAEPALTMSQQDDDAAGAGDTIRAVDPERRDLVRRIAEKPQAAVTRHRQRQLADPFDGEGTRGGAAVVRHRKQTTGGRDAAVIAVAARQVAKEGPGPQKRRRPVSDARVPSGKRQRGIEAAPPFVRQGEWCQVAVIEAVDADVV